MTFLPCIGGKTLISIHDYHSRCDSFLQTSIPEITLGLKRLNSVLTRESLKSVRTELRMMLMRLVRLISNVLALHHPNWPNFAHENRESSHWPKPHCSLHNMAIELLRGIFVSWGMSAWIEASRCVGHPLWTSDDSVTGIPLVWCQT